MGSHPEERRADRSWNKDTFLFVRFVDRCFFSSKVGHPSDKKKQDLLRFVKVARCGAMSIDLDAAAGVDHAHSLCHVAFTLLATISSSLDL